MIQCLYKNELLASVRTLGKLAQEEDRPSRDLTSDLLPKRNVQTEARIFCRERSIMAGAVWIPELVQGFFPDDAPEIKVLHQDGSILEPGTTLIELSGKYRDLLFFERTLLNFLGRSVGIANATERFVAKVRAIPSKTQILDTRKTLPGFRYFDKYAVLCGGGQNHRMNLSDQILIKENHVPDLGGLERALDLAFEAANGADFILEVRTLEEAEYAFSRGCPIVMLDNFSPDEVKTACALKRTKTQIEVSGGINLENVCDYAVHQPDRISIGAITHSVKAPDLSMLMEDV